MGSKKNSNEKRNSWKNGLGLAILGIGIAIACVACLPAAGFVVAGVMVSSTAIAATTAALSATAIVAATAKAGLHAYDAEYGEAALSLASAVPFVGTLQASMVQLNSKNAIMLGKGQTGAKGSGSSSNQNIKPNTTAESPAKTGGRLGNEATREQNKQIGDYLEANGYDITGGGGRMPEEYLPGPNGNKGSNYVDITAKKNGQTVRINTVDTYASGRMTSREASAAASINSKTGDQIITIPKGSGLGDLPNKLP